MAGPSRTQRVFFLRSPTKPTGEALLEELCSFATLHCNVVGAEVGLDGRAAVEARADRIVVLGGDGTLIGVARSLASNQIPLIGVNVGKLGFLAEFSPEELKRCFAQAVSDDSIISRRAILHVTMLRNGCRSGSNLAINDCVIQAGPPFRIIHLDIAVNGDHLIGVAGDGLIICTPSGSTAHNLSAGGPIMQPGIDAMILTPLCPHSLTHRPMVIERDAVIDVRVGDVNEGTTVITDGQVASPLQPGDSVTVRRFDTDFLLVHNPLYAKWHNLVTKLHWGQAPSYD